MGTPVTRARFAEDCEIRRKGRRPRAALGLGLALLLAGALMAPPAGRLPLFAPATVFAAADAGQAATPPAGEESGESPWAMLARLANFAIVAGALVYLLRSPFAKYLEERRTQIRAELVKADEMREAATGRLTEIDRRMQTLPAELEALKVRGAEEIQAEEARIERVAAADRERLLEQARRAIDLQLRAAERDLTVRAAELSVSLATERIKRSMTEADQLRLVDRYVQQLDATR